MSLEKLIDNPRESILLQSFATKAVLRAEDTGLTGPAKQSIAEALVIKYLHNYYEEQDAKYNYPWILDISVKFLIDLIPDIIREIVRMLNRKR